jgi:hypothetical protein
MTTQASKQGHLIRMALFSTQARIQYFLQNRLSTRVVIGNFRLPMKKKVTRPSRAKLRQ